MEQGTAVNWATGMVSGPAVQISAKTLGQIRGIFHDQQAARQLPDNLELYSVQVFAPAAEGTEGGLYWGNTTLQPGKIGDEYYMTKGHFHQIRNRAEYYATFQGEGALLLMGDDRVTRCETMRPGSLHYIPGETAHRVANTGAVPLVFGACWPTDAGHDYETIERDGFSARLLDREGRPVLVPRG